MDVLIRELKSSSLHFIRCIKPNEVKLPDHFVNYLALK